jgi:hypothetical protein
MGPFERANLNHWTTPVKVKDRVTLWQAVYRQSVCLGIKPDQRVFFLQLNTSGDNPYVTSSLSRRWVCLLRICLAFRQAYILHLQHVIENSFFCTVYKSSVSTGFAKQIMPVLCILFYNGSWVTWMVLSLTTAKFKPLIFSVSGFALSYTMNMFILIILYDLFMSRAQFCYIIVYMGKIESHVQIADRCAPWKISSGAENLMGICC